MTLMLGAIKRFLGRGEPSVEHPPLPQTIIPLVKAVVPHGPEPTLTIPQDQQPIFVPLVGELVYTYVTDEERTFRYLNRSDLRNLKLTPEELHVLALRNLPLRTPEIKIHGGNAEFMVTCGGNLEATLLLHDGLWTEIQGQFKGNPLAAVPSRDLLFVTDSVSPNAAAFFQRVLSVELSDKSHMLSSQVMERRSGAWQLFQQPS